MLELKINKKDISLDPFEIVAWEDQELAMALFGIEARGGREETGTQSPAYSHRQ